MLPSIIYKNRGHFTPKESFGLEGRLNPHLPFRQSQVCECGRMQQCYLLRSQMFLHLCLCPVNSYNLFALSKPWHPRGWCVFLCYLHNDYTDGGEGNRTPVQYKFHINFYIVSLLLLILQTKLFVFPTSK